MRQLKGLEARVNDAPDSVLAVLTAADMPRWGERRALYALLTVQAQDKSYIDVADDSLIRVATRYYDRRGPALHRLQAFYYHGRVYANAGLRHEAMAAYTRAKDFVNEVDAPYPVGLLYLQMGVLYGNDYDYSQGVAYMEEASHYFGMTGKGRLQNIAKRNIGQFYLNMEYVIQAESILNEVLLWGKTNDDAYIVHSTLDLLLRLYDATGSTDVLDSLLKDYSIDNVLQSSSGYSIVAHYYAQKGNMIAAKEALNQAWEVSVTAADTAMLWQKSYQIYKTLDLPYDALHSHEELLAHQDSVVRITLRQPLIASQLNQYQSRLEVEELRNLNYRYVIGITALVLLLVAILLYLYIRRYLRDKDKQLMQQIELADELRLTIYNKEEDLDKMFDELHAQRITFNTKLQAMNQQISELFRARYKLLDELSKTYYENRIAKDEKQLLYDKVMHEIKSLSVDKDFAKLEKIINEYCDNVMACIRAELPGIFSKIDYQLLCCFYIGFSGKTISVFTGIEANQIPVYKQRFRNKIYKSNAPSKQLMLDKMK